MLVAATVVYAVTGLGGAFDREFVTTFDALLIVVLGLVLYGMSARQPSASPNWMDGIQLVAVSSALVLDTIVLAAMIARLGDLGFSPNRIAALGLNLVLLVNLAGAAWLSIRYLIHRTPFHQLERWQTGYLPVLALWPPPPPSSYHRFSASTDALARDHFAPEQSRENRRENALTHAPAGAVLPPGPKHGSPAVRCRVVSRGATRGACFCPYRLQAPRRRARGA